MHIEPGIVVGAKLALGFFTATGAVGYAAKLAKDMSARDGIPALAVRILLAAVLVLSFFQLLPHFPVGVSEVHFILGSTLFLMFGAGPAREAVRPLVLHARRSRRADAHSWVVLCAMLRGLARACAR